MLRWSSSFRVGSEDATYLAREFQVRFDEVDLLQLPNYCVCLKLMIDGVPSKPFSATTMERQPGPKRALGARTERRNEGLILQDQCHALSPPHLYRASCECGQ